MNKNLLMVMLLILLAFLPIDGCSKEEQPVYEKPKVVLPIKKPKRKEPLTPLPQPRANQEASLSNKLATIELKQPGPAKPDEKVKKQFVPDDEGAGYYKVQKGDNLYKIASRKDVYGDPIKWPSLFRLNMDLLGGMRVAEGFLLKWSSVFNFDVEGLDGIKVLENFQHQELPEGLTLRFATPHEVKENLAKLGQKYWVVNVLSSQTSKELVPPAIRLMKNGYRVYITRAMVNGKEWMRLRAGFFGDLSDAEAAGKKIVTILKASEFWAARIEKEELEKFGGY